MTDRRKRIAELLKERYEVEKLLGEGGFASVYRVRNLRLGRTEALKVLSQHMTEESDFARRFEQEAKVSASLDHPNIVKIYDYGVTEEIAWFSMQLVQGESLAAELASRPVGMEPAEVAEIAVSILEALEYSHARGVIHRDIKPDNILLDDARRPYVTDFGIAKAEDSLVKTRTGMLFGSPAYMAPEQIAGAVPDGRTDVYALGVTLYRMLTLAYPFSGDDTLRMAMKKLSEVPEPLLAKRPELPPNLASVVMTALEKEPAKRFATAGLMRQELEDYLQAFGRPRRNGGSQRSFTPREAGTKEETLLAGSAGLESTIRAAEPTELDQRERGGRTSRLVLVGMAGLLLVFGAAWWWSHRTEAETPPAVAVAALSAPVALEPTRVPEPPTPLPSPAAAEVVPTVVPTTREPRRREAAAPAAVLQAKLGSSAPPSAPNAIPTMRASAIQYCGTIEPTAYRQSAAQELPSGFSSDEGEMGRAPRPDSARIQLEIAIRPLQPKEEEPFEVTVRLVNGGDSDLEVARVEESAVRASGGFQTVAGIALPTTVSVGGTANIYRYTGVLRGGSTYFKELRVTDSLGDSWKTSIRLLPCPGN